MLKVKIKKLNNSAVVPKYAQHGDAGMDLVAVTSCEVENKEYGYIEYGTGLAMEIPEGYYGKLVPRSSISKTGLIMANSPGTIDSGYRGEVKVRFKWVADSAKYKLGERVAQLIILPYPQIEFVEVEELSNTERSDGGFGSTGK